MCGRRRDGWSFGFERITRRESLGAYAMHPAIHLGCAAAGAARSPRVARA